MKRKRNKTRHTGMQLSRALGGVYDESLYGIKPSYVKHFWPFDEYKFSNSFVDKIHDVVQGFNIPQVANSLSPYGVTAPLNDAWHSSVASGSRYLNEDESGNFECFNGTDWMILIASKGKSESCFECTIGRPSSEVSAEGMFLKIQPYYFAINFDGLWQTQPWGYLWTKQRDSDAVFRVVGTEYIIAYIKRGERIEHWINGVLQDTAEIGLLRQAAGRTYGDNCVKAADSIPKMRPLARIRFGHSGTGLMNQNLRTDHTDYNYPHMKDGDTPAYVEMPAGFGEDGNPVVNEMTQYAGIMFASWTPQEMPSVADMPAFMNWHASQWFAGNKRVDWDGT